MKRTTAILTLAVGALVLSSLTFRARKADREIEETLHGPARIVDFGVVLHTVIKDPRGEQLVEGAPRWRIVRTHRFGGLYDTLVRSWCGPSAAPVTWYVSEDQELAVIHPDELPEGVWFQGSFGAGKTTSGGMWAGLRVIKHALHPLKGAGITAPTDKRMEEIRKVLFGPKNMSGERTGGLWPKPWFTWREGDQVAVMATGLQIDFRSTYVQSEQLGSPLQGQNWAWTWNDELQDYFHLDGDIQMRGRAAWQGRYERFVSATPKATAAYRNFKAGIDTSPDWHVVKVAIVERTGDGTIVSRSPFVEDEYVRRRLANLPAREAQSKIWGDDVAPERQIYVEFDRRENLRPLPRIGAQDVTRQVLAPWGPLYTVLLGHDPGTLQDVTLVLKAYRERGDDFYCWWVVDEVTTPQSTAEEHAAALMAVLRDKFRVQLLDRKNRLVDGGELALMRADPYGNTDRRPDRSTYTVLRNPPHHLMVLPAAFRAGTTSPGRVPKKEGIEMVRRLLCDVNGRRRLFVACDDRGQPVAPKLVEAFEQAEYNALGEAETERKDARDLSHWPAALRYALWALERPRRFDSDEETG